MSKFAQYVTNAVASCKRINVIQGTPEAVRAVQQILDPNDQMLPPHWDRLAFYNYVTPNGNIAWQAIIERGGEVTTYSDTYSTF